MPESGLSLHCLKCGRPWLYMEVSRKQILVALSCVCGELAPFVICHHSNCSHHSLSPNVWLSDELHQKVGRQAAQRKGRLCRVTATWQKSDASQSPGVVSQCVKCLLNNMITLRLASNQQRSSHVRHSTARYMIGKLTDELKYSKDVKQLKH